MAMDLVKKIYKVGPKQVLLYSTYILLQLLLILYTETTFLCSFSHHSHASVRVPQAEKAERCLFSFIF